MIVQDRIRIGAVVRSVWRPLLALLAFDCLVTFAYLGLGWTWIAPPDVPLPLLGTGLAVFLGLRNNTAYARWWEARTLWGAVVNQSRSFARGLAVLLPAERDAGLREELVEHQIAWVHALRSTLRKQNPLQASRGHLSANAADTIEGRGNVPFEIQRRMAGLLGTALRDGRLDTISASALNTTLGSLADAQGGLERIANTPMPRQYASFPRLFVAVYCAMLPFGVVADLGVLTPLGSTLIGFLFLALDAAGRNLEAPFRRSVHEVPMSAVARTIEIDLKQALGRAASPAPMHPVFGILR